MGKLPPSLRTSKNLVPPVRSLLPNLQSSTHEPQSQQPPYPHRKTPKSTTTTHRPPPPPPPITFTSPDISAAKTLFTSLTTTTKHPSLLTNRFCNKILESFTSVSSNIQDSIFLLTHMTKVNPLFTPDKSSYHILLTQSCTKPNSDLSNVDQVLTLMGSKGFQPDKVSTDIAIRTLCGSGYEDHAIELIKKLSQVEFTKPDTYTYNLLVKRLIKVQSLSSVNAFINEMKIGFDLKPDLVTYTILIDNVCNGKNLREAMRLLDVLKEEGFKPDCYVYNTIMKGYCMLSHGGEVLRVFKKMVEEEIEPDLVTYNTLIYGLSKSGKVKEAKKFVKEMAKMGHFPDVVTYTSLMNGLCRDGKALGALELLGEMESKGCSPNECTYNTLLHGLCKARQLDKGVELYNVMKENDMKLESGSYGTFLRALCRSGKVAEAYEVFDYALESKSLTEVAAYTTLESTLKWLKKAKEQGLAV
ncbi:putative tetratricopeptide-like helical domain superfamily [Helianthus annuus]|uniref:Tetratricopeptide-like helical domain superfamily n=1 Tax=Helianthus annuus TaxID=4232 RepID=A0A9K3ILK3_HELAN|nr:pentatricopeptide repeat-containing protein At2g17670 [Helianthus annuus]XP_035831606.1 pentatricopeptide repeat-containing protein At2g17670 [Helianthus annuus]KAF5798610.1 putative tetratricopeptide-like helical domain superfamily [Helianthus annuus]KAJ0550188.1 putative tetratricopeptide-like helical domain superfamily [Helianthus annuus]KAJ0563143.1 putative tetratricopeptide-like helical domain superfamily [Helianthus annuus]KAJ0728511.1 putative tetratricopeptide-like helical domain s